MIICFADPTSGFEESEKNSKSFSNFKLIFDKEISIGNISGPQRNKLISLFLTKAGISISSEIQELILQKTSSFTLGEVLKMVKELKFRKHCLTKTQGKSILSRREVKEIFREMTPVNFKKFAVETSSTKWSDIGGYTQVKARIQTIVELPNKSPQTFLKRGILPSKGLLLYGPPGCSKTMFARAIASESNLGFLAVSGPEIFGKYVGQSEKKIRELFRSARLAAPCVIFFDEIDAVATSRGGKSTGVHDRVLMQLLTEMDGVGSLDGKEVLRAYANKQSNPADSGALSQFEKLLETFTQNRVIVIAATNRPDVLDKAIIRPGRFDELVYIGLPDQKARFEIFEIHLQGMLRASEVEVSWLVQKSKGYSGAEITQIVREAAMQSILEESGFLEGTETQENKTESLFSNVIKADSLFEKSTHVEQSLDFEGNFIQRGINKKKILGRVRMKKH